MGRINTVATLLQKVATLEDLRRFSGAALDAILTQLNGKIDFGDNIRADGPVELELTASTPTRVFHNLGRAPIGYLIVEQSAHGSVIHPTGSEFEWTSQQIFIQSSVDMTIKFFVI
jgi:hypothetical protein